MGDIYNWYGGAVQFFQTSWNTNADNAPFRLNSRSYTQATGDSIGIASTVNQTVASTGEVYCAQFKGRATAVSVAAINGLEVDAEIRSASAATTGGVRALNVYLGSNNASQTISGDVCVIRCRWEGSTALASNQQAVLATILNNEGAQPWDGFVHLVSSGGGDVALGTHTMTTNSDKTGNTKSGTIKVYCGNTLYHIQLYAD